MKAKDLIAVIRDEIDHKHQMAMYGMDVQEKAIADLEVDDPGKAQAKIHLRSIHIPITKAMDITDDERHTFLSRLLDRQITTAKQVTNIEAQCMGAVMQNIDPDELAEAINEMVK